MPHLKIVAGYNEGESFSLEGTVTMGRSLTNSICLLDNRASRRHATITERDGKFFLQDQKSANGTFHNGVALQSDEEVELSDGDEILICSTQILYEDDRKKTAPSPHGKASLGSVLGVKQSQSSKDFGDISVHLESEENGSATPEMDLSLDASMSMVDIPAIKTGAAGLEESVKRLKAMCEVSIALGVVSNQTSLMNRIMDFIFDIFPKADRAFIMLVDHEGTLQPVAARLRSGTQGIKEDVAVSRTVLNDVMKNKKSVITSDAQQDERFGAQMSIVNLSIRSMMCAPLLVGKEILGVIQVDSLSVTAKFETEDLQLLTGISSQAAIAVKNTQLYGQVEAETARRTSLQRYFSPNMVDLIMSGDMGNELGGKKYTGTVFFSDIIGFTAMSEKVAPNEVVSRLNNYFNIMQKLIYQNGGNVDKFGGDAIMAFWSVPRRKEDDELSAVLTGLQMQGQLFPFNMQLVDEGATPIHMGIGINTGEFVAGNIGSADKIEFTLIGDNVNLAARIEAKAGRGQVFISDTTYEQIANKVCAVKLPPAQLKGKSKSADIYSVRGLTQCGGDFTLSVPCQILDVKGQSLGPGMIIAMTSHGPDLNMIFSSTKHIPTGSTVGLRLEVREHHEPLALVTRVDSSTEVTHDCGAVHARNICSEVKGEAALAWLRPGGLLHTEHSWDQIRRD